MTATLEPAPLTLVETEPGRTERPSAAPTTWPWPALLRRALAAGTIFTVGFLVYLFAFSTLPFGRSQKALSQRLEAQLAAGLAPVNEVADPTATQGGPTPVGPGDPIARLEIPDIGVESIVIEGTDASRLMHGPGHLEGSALPGQPGTSVLVGRCCTFGRPFGRIGELQSGDTIDVVTGQGKLTYTVTETGSFAAGDPQPFAATGANELVLVTSDGVGASRRYAVRATTDTPQAAGARRPHDPPSVGELGLAGDRSAAGALLVWAEVLLVVSLIAVVLHRRWRRWPAWVLCVPPLLAALWLTYEQLARLLPGAV